MSSYIPVQGVCQVSADRGSKPLNIVYQLHGTGTQRVLLIMGHNGTLDAWQLQTRFLVQHGYQVCVFDNRNIGRSDKANEPFTVMDMALDTIELLNHLEWTSGVHLVGISMGGAISQLLASHYPQYFISVCLTSTFMDINAMKNSKSYNLIFSPPVYSSEKERIEVYKYILFPKHWLDSPSEFAPTKTNSQLLIDLYEDSPFKTDSTTVDLQLEAIRQYVLTKEEIDSIRIGKLPVLVCTGDEDSLIDPNNSECIARALECPLKIFKGCGHVVIIQEPDLYNQTLLKHFQGIKNSIKANA
ncbi:Alpha/Beta hydrolase protein [Syncephalis fuscata]|nr:Alpha/Beta hydrolase protein [Syncephalis fuscata]